MQTRNRNIETGKRRLTISSPPDPAAGAPLNGERITADAPITPERDRSRPASDGAEIEYASWLWLLRRTSR